LLRKQGYELGDRPPAGVKLHLRKTANLKTGGKLEDVTSSIHPDNVAMAEAIARNFRLDAVGIDFIIPDIGTSWRAIDCAVIEINSVPGIGDYLAEKIISDKFPAGSDGRIPSVLLVAQDTELTSRLARLLNESDTCLGQTSGEMTLLGEELRFKSKADLPERIMSLLLDPKCDALMVCCTSDDIVAYGLPHTRFDVAMIAEATSLANDVRKLISDNSSVIVEHVTCATLDATVRPVIDRIFARRRPVVA
jgi:cyanophycin synthetase